MTTFSLKDYYENLGVTGEEQEKELAKLRQTIVDELKKKQEEDIANEYSGRIPIPFMGWVQINEAIDREDRETMLREQIHIVNAQLHEAQAIIAEQRQVLELYQEFIKEKNLLHLWMYFMGDRKNG